MSLWEGGKKRVAPPKSVIASKGAGIRRTIGSRSYLLDADKVNSSALHWSRIFKVTDETALRIPVNAAVPIEIIAKVRYT